MKKLTTCLVTFALASAIAAPAFASSPDIYVVNFRNIKNAESQDLDRKLPAAISMVGGNLEHVVIDTSNAAKWEKGAHEAFDRNIVPVFNKWVGLPGFAAVIDAKSKRVLGCVNPKFNTHEMVQELRRMSSQVNGQAYMSPASMGKSTACPPAHNELPK